MPSYMHDILGSYMSNRSLLVKSGDTVQTVVMPSRVSPWLVLGSTPWNPIYDEVPDIQLLEEVRTVRFTDDVSLVIVSHSIKGL